VALQDGDVMQVHWNELGRALCNPLSVIKRDEKLVEIRALPA
jgi:hypothetical protein